MTATAATLSTSHYTLVGLQGSDGATVTETVGTYGSPNAGLRAVTATLDAGDFTADGATLLSTYICRPRPSARAASTRPR